MCAFESKKPLPKHTDVEWLKGIQAAMPQAIICIESRPLTECRTISSAVIPDAAFETTTVIVNVSLQRLITLRVAKIVPEMEITEERPRLPQLVVNGETMYQFNNRTEAHLVLTTPDGDMHLNFPWAPELFDILEKTKRWIIWSLADEDAGAETYYWGYGEFGSSEAFDKYIAERLGL